jgi:hypothetical protein
MEMYCAACGCLVNSEVRLISCDTSECCCLGLPMAAPMETLAVRVRDAINARDMGAFRALIADDARWGYGGPDDARTCQNRHEIIANYKRLLAEGMRGTVTETATGPRGLVCVVEMQWPDNASNERGPAVYQAFFVTDGLITLIQGHENLDLAVAAIAT